MIYFFAPEPVHSLCLTHIFTISIPERAKCQTNNFYKKLKIMKKKILLAAGAAMLAAAVSAAVYVENLNKTDNFFSANVEALSMNESDYDGYLKVKKDESKHKLICEGIGHQKCVMD